MSFKKPKYPDPLPSWFVSMNIRGALTAKDVMSLFGYKNISSIDDEFFPKADFATKGSFSKFRRPSRRWSKAVIMAEIERRKSLAEEPA